MKTIKLLVLLNLLLAGCGKDSSDPAPPPSPPVVLQPGAKLSYQQMQGLMNQYCKSCHTSDNFIASEAGLKGSKAQVRLTNKSMPPSFASLKLPDNIRTQMLSYF